MPGERSERAANKEISEWTIKEAIRLINIYHFLNYVDILQPPINLYQVNWK